MLRRLCVPATCALVLALAACGGDHDGEEAIQYEPATQSPQWAFWGNLSQYCGQAFEGRIVSRPETDQLFRGDEVMTVHFRACDRETLAIPFHVEDNRSRTWVLTWVEEGEILDLRHDHRHPDGTPEDNTMYGAATVDRGTPYAQEFIREGSDPPTGWRIEIHPGDRYTYGTIRDGEWRYRIDFDLTSEVEPPPAPWGHEDPR